MFGRKTRFILTPFDFAASCDPEMARIIDEAVEAIALSNDWCAHQTVASISSIASGRELLRKDGEWNRRGLIAIVEQGLYWRLQQRRVEAQAENETERINSHALPGGEMVWRRTLAIHRLMSVLSRRRLPLTDDDLLGLIEAAISTLDSYRGAADPAAVIRQAGFVAKARGLSEPIRLALGRLHEGLDGRHLGEPNEDQARIAKLLAGPADASSGPIAPPPLPPEPARAGRDTVLVALKRELGLMPDDEVATEEIGPDAFPLRADSPFAEEHARIGVFLTEVAETRHYHEPSLTVVPEGRAWIKLTPEERGRLLLAACERAVAATRSGEYEEWQFRYAALGLPDSVVEAGVRLDRDDLFDALLHASALHSATNERTRTLTRLLRTTVPDRGFTTGERYVLHRLRCMLIDTPPLGACPPLARQICDLLGEPDTLVLVPGEHWADAVHADLASMDETGRGAWVELLRDAATATSTRPSATWSRNARRLRAAIGDASFRERVQAWFAVVPKGRSIRTLVVYSNDRRGADTIDEGGATILRGLLWMLTEVPDRETPRAVADLLLTCVKKVPGVGPRAVKVANACIWSLGRMAAADDDTLRDGALAQLARLKSRVTFKTTRKAIERALDEAAAHAGMSREDLEELGVPAFGFEDGVRREAFGDASVELRVAGTRVGTRWTNAGGKAIKNPPAAVKREHVDDVKVLKQVAKDAEGILGAGRTRLDTLYLAEKSWSLAEWRERYLDHGLMGTLARRLIWVVGDTAVMFQDDGVADAEGRPVAVRDDAVVRLWHPVGSEADEVLAWRRRIETSGITQPFKQAHREIYLLTDAERTTGVYSNRFAAHVLKQHQFNALCGARGWRNTLRLLVDDCFPPATRQIPAHGLRAEFWIEGAGDHYGTDTNEAGTFHYLTTDQVRFHRIGAASNEAGAGGGRFGSVATGPGDGNINEPVDFDQVPPLVLSEILRDVDLFVGVASVGNDPMWADGGPGGRYRAYWNGYAFGDLSATAHTRKAALERLVPKLRIAARCTFDDRFLVVRGSIRTYRIHLGSGNIQMAPNDEYLCIVPKAFAMNDETDTIFLPFEGDRTMAIILSKALLLADDDRITDRTILAQIRRGS